MRSRNYPPSLHESRNLAHIPDVAAVIALIAAKFPYSRCRSLPCENDAKSRGVQADRTSRTKSIEIMRGSRGTVDRVKSFHDPWHRYGMPRIRRSVRLTHPTFRRATGT